MIRYWLVICPEPKVIGGVWQKWFAENCVAVGWPPPSHQFHGKDKDGGWSMARNRLKEIKQNDKIIPFLLKWRIGPVGTVIAVKAEDKDWSPTVKEGAYKRNKKEPELGRRISIKWENDHMPRNGQVITIPQKQRKGKQPLSRQTIKEISRKEFDNLKMMLKNPDNWVTIPSGNLP